MENSLSVHKNLRPVRGMYCLLTTAFQWVPCSGSRLGLEPEAKEVGEPIRAKTGVLVQFLNYSFVSSAPDVNARGACAVRCGNDRASQLDAQFLLRLGQRPVASVGELEYRGLDQPAWFLAFPDRLLQPLDHFRREKLLP